MKPFISFSLSTLAFTIAAPALTFNTTTPENNLKEDFQARIQFAQSQVIPVQPKAGDRQPHLISQRAALLLVRPLTADDTTPITVTAYNSDGESFGTAKLNPPAQLPTTAYHIEDLPAEGVDFKPKSDSTATVHNHSDLEKVADPKSTHLGKLLADHDLIKIDVADGRWVGDIHLPEKAPEDGKVIEVKSTAGYSTTIHHSGRKASLSRGQTIKLQFHGSQWVHEGEAELNNLKYADHTWSVKLPAQYIQPSLTLTFKQGNKTGKLDNLKVGAPTELLIHTIDVGMLTTPRDRFDFANDPTAHREYFQTLPTSRLIVSQYNPLTLEKVVLADGTRLTDFDPSEGGWHSGTMRQVIGKELISIGIDNANYGINSTAGRGEDTHPYHAAQLTAHNSRGKYANGIQVHGGSGGGGIVTLDSSIGNEFSHEVGHNYGLGHYVDGFRGSIHRSAENINSTWGWDADKNRFIPNFYPTRGGDKACLDDQCQDPFHGEYKFGSCPMAGGSPFSSFNRFTMHPPNTAAIIQEFLEDKVVFAPESPTGFKKWNPETQKMEPWKNTIPLTTQVNAPINQLSEEKITELLSQSNLINVSMADGNWTGDIPVPPASITNSNRAISINHHAGYPTTLHINGEKVRVQNGFKKTYVSNGKKWQEKDFQHETIERKPRAFGVPVVTLIGYYDPTGDLPTTIYPALHGAFGYCYDPDAKNIKPSDTYLQVRTRNGDLKYRLDSTRLNDGNMNKFHINIPQSVAPSTVAIIRNGKVLDRRAIPPATTKPTFTVHGNPLPKTE